VGFCLGGRLGLYLAGTRPERMRATASLHGTFLVSEKAESPHLLADRFRGAIYCAFAEHDEWVGPEVIPTLDRVIGANPNVAYQKVVHPDTTHGYSIPDRNVYDQAAAERDWAAIFEMFAKQLKEKSNASS
jgi:carboxymethylenebutenolidase